MTRMMWIEEEDGGRYSSAGQRRRHGIHEVGDRATEHQQPILDIDVCSTEAHCMSAVGSQTPNTLIEIDVARVIITRCLCTGERGG